MVSRSKCFSLAKASSCARLVSADGGRRKRLHACPRKKVAARLLEPDRYAVSGRLQRECAEISGHLPDSCGRKRQGAARSDGTARWRAVRRPLHSFLAHGWVSGGPIQQARRDHLDKSV